MADAIEFFFDFSSPYAYLASRQLPTLAARYGRDLWWRPTMLGPALAATGAKPLVQLPLEGDYARRDLARSARFRGVPFVMPSRFPVVTLAAAPAFYWLAGVAPERPVPFAEAAFTALFAEDRDLADRAVVAELLAAVGADAAAGLVAIDTAEIKARLKAETEAAVARGVFGSPFLFVDGEPFWGADRLEQVERWLETGGF